MFLTLVLLFLGIASHAAPPPLRVAAAADLEPVGRELVAAYSRAHPKQKVEVTFGSSGTLASQIAQGAPFDLFLSADRRYAESLVKKGLVKSADLFLYARSGVAIWISRRIRTDGLPSAAWLTHARVKTIAIPNPRHAPYGRSALAALEALKIADAVKAKLVLGENVAQTAQFAVSGNADAAILPRGWAESDRLSAVGKSWAVPEKTLAPANQIGAVLARAHDPKAARRFRAVILGPQGRAALERHGFLVPEPSAKGK